MTPETTPVRSGRPAWAVALAVVLVLGVFVYLGLSRASEPRTVPATPLVAATARASATAPARVAVEPLPSTQQRPSNPYAVVLSMDGADEAEAVLEAADRGAMRAAFQIRTPSNVSANGDLRLVQHVGHAKEPLAVGTWPVIVDAGDDRSANVLDFTAAPAPNELDLPRLVRAGYNIHAVASGGADEQVLTVDVRVGRVDILEASEVYAVESVVAGDRLVAALYPLEPGHFHAEVDWPTNRARTFAFALHLAESSYGDLVDRDEIGTWTVTLVSRDQISEDTVGILSMHVPADREHLARLAYRGFRLTVSEYSYGDSITVAFDAVADATR